MFTNSKLAKSVRLAMMVGAASTALPVTYAFAADEEAGEVERIEVTGSRIKRADLETNQPVTVISAEDITASGMTNIGDFLQTTSQADLSGLTQLTNNTNGNDGTQTLSLRNLGSSRTLVLVDGRRWLALGGGQVDLSQIPTAIVSRVEILGDGASAVYGTDAIAGVVNIVTKRGFEGLEVQASTGANFEGDGERNQASFSAGINKDKLSMFINIDKTENKEIGAGDREISRTPQFGVPQRQGSAFGLYGIFRTSDGFKSLIPEREGAGMRTPDDFRSFGTNARYNFAPTNYLFTPSERLSVFSKIDYEFTDNLRFVSQFTFNQRKSVTQIAAVPIVAGFSGPQWEIPYSKDNVYNPFGEDLTAWGFRTLPVGPRTTIQDYDTYFFSGGLEGEFELADRFLAWDINFMRGESSRAERGENYINLGNLRNAVGPSFYDEAGIATCGTPDNPIRGCVPLNLFNGVTGFTEDMQNYVGYDFNESVRAGTTNLSGNLSGDLFELPAGMVTFAVGFEFRENTFTDNPDSLISSGLSSSNFREPTRGSQTADEYYFEVNIPVIEDLPFAQKVELNIAGRASDFENSGFVGTNPVVSEFDNDSYKAGLTWRVNEELLLRGNYSDTFRAPSVNNLFSGGGEGFPSVADPCNDERFSTISASAQAACIRDGVPDGGYAQPTNQLRSLNGGNPFLKPESGTTKTIGVVYNPEWLEGFDITLDHFDIELEDALSTIGASGMLNRCYNQGLNDFCGFIERRPDGRISTIRTSQFNLAKLETKGVDFSANYVMSTDEMGDFAFRLKGTYTDSYRSAGSEENLSEAINQVGAIDFETLRWRSTLTTTWSYDDLSVTWAMRYTSQILESCPYSTDYIAANADFNLCNARDEVSEDNPNGLNRLGSVVYHDLSASYSLPWDARLTVGTRNLFRKDPPPSLNAFANSYFSGHDIPGGEWFVRYKQQF